MLSFVGPAHAQQAASRGSVPRPAGGEDPYANLGMSASDQWTRNWEKKMAEADKEIAARVQARQGEVAQADDQSKLALIALAVFLAIPLFILFGGSGDAPAPAPDA